MAEKIDTNNRKLLRMIEVSDSESLREAQKRLDEENAKERLALAFGVDPMRWDYCNLDKRIFKSKSEDDQHNKDISELLVRINSGKDIPVDLANRLLIIKERKDKLGIQY